MSVTSWQETSHSAHWYIVPYGQKSHKSVQILQNIFISQNYSKYIYMICLIWKDLIDLTFPSAVELNLLAKRLLTGNFTFSTLIYSALRAEISQICSNLTLTLRMIATKSHKNKKNKKNDRQLKTVSYLCCLKEESVCRRGKPEIFQAQRLQFV